MVVDLSFKRGFHLHMLAYQTVCVCVCVQTTFRKDMLPGDLDVTLLVRIAKHGSQVCADCNEWSFALICLYCKPADVFEVAF